MRPRPTTGRTLALLLAVAAPAAPAAAGDVISAGPDTVSVTVYRDRPMRTDELAALGEDDTHGLALVVETRTVDLPAGRSRLRFEGVADGMAPQSAGVDGLPARILERNYDYDLMTPGALIDRSIGAAVQLVRTDRKTGRETREAAILRSGPDGVMLDAGGRVEALGCGGESERLVFDRVPADLAARPTLSLQVDAPRAGRYRLRLSYLTVRLDWSADYIARVAPDGRTVALSGWITLSNRTSNTFSDAPIEVVAGRLARVPVDIPAAEPRVREPHCWPSGTTHGPWSSALARATLLQDEGAMVPAPMRLFAAKASEVVVTALKRAVESQLGDYKLYTLPEPTTLAARQTKQVAFLDRAGVRFRTVYAHTVQEGPLAEARGRPDAPPLIEAARSILRFRNTAYEGLGQALPSGAVQVRLTRPNGRELFAGEPALSRDVPVGEPFELDIGEAPNVTVAARLTSDQPLGRGRGRRAFEVRVANARAAPAAVELRHDRAGAAGFRVVSESAPHGQKAGDPLWRLDLGPGETRTLTYAVESARP